MTPYLIAIAVIAVLFVLPAWLGFRKEEAAARAELERAEAAGRREPVSIRPVVDTSRCMGSGACVTACPEHRVLQVLDGQATLVNASSCVGHGACVRACPTRALELVFGSERRGVDLPELGPDFQSNVPGLYVVGELGGMGLIANAVQQGVQVASQLMKRKRTVPEGGVDLVVVGAGPAGIACALEARAKGLSVELLEQGTFGGAIRHYPRAKIVMSRGFALPGQKRVPGGSLSKERLIDILARAIDDAGLQVSEGERVEAVARQDDGSFEVRTTKRTLGAGRVVLAVGRRGTPRRLEVAGEEAEKVAYRLLEPERYEHRHVLVVGGGDSAVEAALSLSEQRGCRVTLSYRSAQITRPKAENVARLEAAVAAGWVQLELSSTVLEIAADRVRLATSEGERVVPNDHVFVLAGGVLPLAFLHATGIRLKRHFGRRVEDVA